MSRLLALVGLLVCGATLGNGDTVWNTCDGIISHWLSNLELSENPENATITVQWNGLGQKLQEHDCPVDHLSLELWRVDQHSPRPHDFGTQDYFSAFERCNKLEPEHFLFHSTQTYSVNGTETSFLHTVEKEYMFRVCPCHRRRHRSVSCDCQYEEAGHGRPQCSRIFQISLETTSQVMPWCLTGPAVLAHVGKKFEEVSLKSMLMNCTHLLVAGTMASCTPIQSYDHVLLTFHKLENASSQVCWEHRDFGTHNPVKVISRLYSQSPYLENFSHGMGDFTAIVGLAADSSYCVQLEHVRHPYCMREITISHSSTYRMPRVCSVHMAKPITTAACSTHRKPEVLLPFNFAHDPVFFATVLAIVVIIVIAAACIGRRFCFVKQKKKARLTAENEPMISKILTVDGQTGCMLSQAEEPTHVFLLHFLNDEDEEERCRMLRNWIGTMADVVHDIDDDALDEEINQDPEGWVLERLSAPEVRVVLGASRSVTQLLRHSSPTDISSASCSTATSTDGGSESGSSDPRTSWHLEVDNLSSRSCLRAFALKHIQAHLAGNYRQLVVVSFDKLCSDGELAAQSLTPNKGPLVLPHHLSDLERWVQSGQTKNAVPGPCSLVQTTNQFRPDPESPCRL